VELGRDGQVGSWAQHVYVFAVQLHVPVGWLMQRLDGPAVPSLRIKLFPSLALLVSRLPFC